MSKSKIQWTDRVWNPIRGCRRVSPGCEHCYAERQAHRFSGPGQPYEGLTMLTRKGTPRWRGHAQFVKSMLDAPLHWTRPSRVFVNSMSDLFHEDLADEEIAAVFGVMAACPQHTFQVLTKRAERLPQWFAWVEQQAQAFAAAPGASAEAEFCAHRSWLNGDLIVKSTPVRCPWPLPNVWMGVSCEDQQRAAERIPCLLDTPAAVRFISAEPLLGELDLERYLKPTLIAHDGERLQHPDPRVVETGGTWQWGLNWVIIGGESGPGARECDVRWIEHILQQCQAAGVACFVKQLGARPIVEFFTTLELRNRKGGEPSEWPSGLHVREYPENRA